MLAACSGGTSAQSTLPAAPAAAAATAATTATTATAATGPLGAQAAVTSRPDAAGAERAIPATALGNQLFYDGFTADTAGQPVSGWTPAGGTWSACQPNGLSMKYCQTGAGGMTVPNVAGAAAWTNYFVQTSAFRDASVSAEGRVMILGHVVDSTHYYDLELRSDIAGSGSLFWYLGKQSGSQWTKLAGGPIVTQTTPYYELGLAFSGSTLAAFVGYGYSKRFAPLGTATDTAYTAGGVGLAAMNDASARFDAVRVVAITGGATPPAATPSPAPTQSAGPSPTPPAATPSPAPSRSADPSPTPPAGTVVWQAGNANLGHYEIASDYQCGQPVNSGTSFTFTLTRSGQSCGRNQAQPTTDNSGDLVRLSDGRRYTFTFDYIDGTPSGAGPGMGYDQLADALIMQIHPYGGGNPCFALAFDNGGMNKVTGQPQYWTLDNCDGGGNSRPVWAGSFTPGERDHWQISILVSQSATTGYIEAYRNGTYLGHWSGAAYSNSGGGSGGPWFNFGPYKSRWELSNGGGSSMTQVNATINNLTVTTQ